MDGASPAAKPLLACPDHCWLRFGHILSAYFERIPPQHYGPHYSRGQVNGHTRLCMDAAATNVMVGFLADPEAIRSVPKSELPHAKKAHDGTASRIYMTSKSTQAVYEAPMELLSTMMTSMGFRQTLSL